MRRKFTCYRCGKYVEAEMDTDGDATCPACENVIDLEPERKLQNRITSLETQLSEARARLAGYDEKSVVIKFMNEDELPKFINDDVYGAMFNCSHVDGVRLFPYVEDSDERYFLILPKVERHSNG